MVLSARFDSLWANSVSWHHRSWPALVNSLRPRQNGHNCADDISFFKYFLFQLKFLFFFSCHQAAIWLVQSVCLSVCPSVTPFSPCSHHHIIMKFSGVITNGKSDVHAKGQGQRSKVKDTEFNTQPNRYRTVTPVWIHIWWWNDAYSLMMLRRGALLFSRSSVKFQRHTALKSVAFDPDWAFPDSNSSLNSPMATKWIHKA